VLLRLWRRNWQASIMPRKNSSSNHLSGSRPTADLRFIGWVEHGMTNPGTGWTTRQKHFQVCQTLYIRSRRKKNVIRAIKQNVINNHIMWTAWLATDAANALPYEDICLAISWLSSPPVNLPRGLYWTANDCNTVGGYICKKNQTSKYQQFHNDNNDKNIICINDALSLLFS